ncbi:MAG: hypothetical protein NC489_46650, partial [Ruminococcus flavefaciens]|nr:hypothetical protein [Ruminococcus flavefaciens]
DLDRNMCLWEVGNLGRDDFDHQRFLFEWNGEEYFITMKYSNPSTGNVVWSVSPYEKEDISDASFIDDFKDALTIYAVNGRPDQQGDIRVKVVITGR